MSISSQDAFGTIPYGRRMTLSSWNFTGSWALARDAVIMEVKAPFARYRSHSIESHGSPKPLELVGRLSFGEEAFCRKFHTRYQRGPSAVRHDVMSALVRDSPHL